MTTKKTAKKVVLKSGTSLKKEPKTVVITRKRWANPKNIAMFNEASGEAVASAALYDTGSKLQCCLGFVCRDIGMRVGDIKDKGFPTEVRNDIPEWLTEVESDAADINDDDCISNKERERKLQALFRENTPIRLKFVP